jgi:hypothetical protein
MHVVEELLELFSQEELTGSKQQDSASDEMETTCSISIHALTGSTTGVPGVIQLHAFIKKHWTLVAQRHLLTASWLLSSQESSLCPHHAR